MRLSALLFLLAFVAMPGAVADGALRVGVDAGTSAAAEDGSDSAALGVGLRAEASASGLGGDLVDVGLDVAPGLPVLPTLSLTASGLGGSADSAGSEPAAQPPASSVVPGVPDAVAGPAAAGSLAVLLAIAWRVLGLGLGSVPFAGRLFSRIEAPRVLENAVRSRIHDLVGTKPGVSIAEVQTATGVAWGTAVHHLRRLEAHGLVVSDVRDARHRYFPANSQASQHRASLSAVSQPTARRIAQLVGQRPGIGQDQLCQELGLNPPAASKHLSKLAGSGLVAVRRQGRHCHYEATGELHAALAIAA